MEIASMFLRESELIDLAFLANNAEEALDLIRKSRRVDEIHAEYLREAARFLDDAASGANFTATGAQGPNFEPVRAFKALDFLVGPGQRALSEVFGEARDIPSLAADLSPALEAASAGRKLSAGQRRSLEHLREFFGRLHEALHAELGINRPRTGKSNEFAYAFR